MIPLSANNEEFVGDESPVDPSFESWFTVANALANNGDDFVEDETPKRGLHDIFREYHLFSLIRGESQALWDFDGKSLNRRDSEGLNLKKRANDEPKRRKKSKKKRNLKAVPAGPKALSGEFIQNEVPHGGTSVKTKKRGFLRRSSRGDFAFVEKPYSLDRSRERARSVLAGALTLLLSLVVLTLVFAVVLGAYQTKDAVSFLGVLLSPLVALVGAATGFYYGGKAANKKS